MSDKMFLDETEIKDIIKLIADTYGEDDEKNAALVAKFNEYLTKRYANINMAENKGVYSLNKDGRFRKH